MPNWNHYQAKLNKIHEKIQQRIFQKESLKSLKSSLEDQSRSLKVREKTLHEACLLLQESSAYSRAKLKNVIEGIVSEALRDIFGDPSMGFEIQYGSSHNKTIANFFVTKIRGSSKVSLDIMNECGGGVADVVALSIRVVLLVYHSKSLSRILMLDEACTSISTFSMDVLENLAKWLKKISEQHDIQIILITQKVELTHEADKVFTVHLDHEGNSIVS